MFFLFLFIFLFVSPTLAVDEFKVSQNIYYSVNNQGTASIKQEVNLSNNFSQIYAKEYQIKLSGASIQNVSGNDANGNIIDQVNSVGDSTNISLKFTQPAVGKDQTNKFYLNYTIANFAKKKGNTWEIQFPTFDNPQDSQDIQIILQIPTSFGELSFASASISSIHSLGENTEIALTPKKNNNKILLVFGNHQLFDFKLSYYLNNPQNTTLITQIPIPPDTNYQDIVLTKIDPQPINIKADADGNWLAIYQLKPAQSVSVQINGQAKIHPPHPNKTEVIQNSYLEPQTYWPVNDPQVINITQGLANVKQIYRYVTDTLFYNYEQIDSAKRRGALLALSSPQSSLCTEFTDLFVTLARSKKIPAREIEGFAYSNNSKVKPLNVNSDVLHAWPEYYDQSTKTWIQIDPTWEKTTNGIDYFSDLDLNHLAFVVHGVSSDNPPPPGSYRNPQNAKSVFVDFATSEIKPSLLPPIITIENNQIIIKNQNPFSLNNFILDEKVFNILPPFSSTTLDVPKTNLFKTLTKKDFKFKINFDELKSPTTISVPNRLHYLYISITIGLSILILCIGGIIVTASTKNK